MEAGPVIDLAETKKIGRNDKNLHLHKKEEDSGRITILNPGAGVDKFRNIGTYFGSIDGKRPQKWLSILKRIKAKYNLPTYFLHDDGNYPTKDASDNYPPTTESTTEEPIIIPIELE